MNELPPGVTTDQIRQAINSSGYPLQLEIASLLASSWFVTEEWSYLDRTTQQLRALDISAYMPLYEDPLRATHNIRPGLELLVECKRSELPFVFFKSAVAPEMADFPQIHRVRDRDVSMRAQAGATKVPLSKLLCLTIEPFMASPHSLCATFSKVVRKGAALELSGSDAFNTVMLPLLSALDHSYRTSVHEEKHHFYFPVLALAVCVVDAPMVLADVATEALSMVSWVRIARHESTSARKGVLGRTGFYGIDVVHRDFFSEYLTNHVKPLAQTFKERVEAKPFILRGGTVAVPDLVSWNWMDISEVTGT